MSQLSEDAKDFARMLRYVANCVDYVQEIKSFHDCNDCGVRKQCKYAPEWGKQVRINCPLWESKS